VEIWDCGEYEFVERREGFLRFRLHGKKLHGTWKLVHSKYPPGNQWLWIASEDAKELSE